MLITKKNKKDLRPIIYDHRAPKHGWFLGFGRSCADGGYTYAIVENADGTVECVDENDITFTDRLADY